MKSYLRRTGATLLLGIFLLPALTPSVQPQTPPWWHYGCPQGPFHKSRAIFQNPGTAG